MATAATETDRDAFEPLLGSFSSGSFRQFQVDLSASQRAFLRTEAAAVRAQQRLSWAGSASGGLHQCALRQDRSGGEIDEFRRLEQLVALENAAQIERQRELQVA